MIPRCLILHYTLYIRCMARVCDHMPTVVNPPAAYTMKEIHELFTTFVLVGGRHSRALHDWLGAHTAGMRGILYLDLSDRSLVWHPVQFVPEGCDRWPEIIGAYEPAATDTAEYDTATEFVLGLGCPVGPGRTALQTVVMRRDAQLAFSGQLGKVRLYGRQWSPDAFGATTFQAVQRSAVDADAGGLRVYCDWTPAAVV